MSAWLRRTLDVRQHHSEPIASGVSSTAIATKVATLCWRRRMSSARRARAGLLRAATRRLALDAGGTHGVALGIARGHPLLAAQRLDRLTGHVRAHDVFATAVVREAVVVAVALTGLRTDVFARIVGAIVGAVVGSCAGRVGVSIVCGIVRKGTVTSRDADFADDTSSELERKAKALSVFALLETVSYLTLFYFWVIARTTS